MSKPRIIRDYLKLSDEMKEQLKLVYPRGYSQHLISFMNKNGDKNLGLPLETEDALYIVRMSKTKALQIVEDDEDFDMDGLLKSEKKAMYEDKYEDLDYLSELNENADNEFNADDEPGEEDSDNFDDDDEF